MFDLAYLGDVRYLSIPHSENCTDGEDFADAGSWQNAQRMAIRVCLVCYR